MVARPQRNSRPKQGKKIPAKQSSRRWTTKLFLWLSGSGLLALFSIAAYDYHTSDIQLEFKRSLSPGYEFTVTNNGPNDRRIETFRVTVPPGQQALYTITQDIVGKQTDKGIVLPGGNTKFLPATEFKALDGQVLKSKSVFTFRLPPLSDQTWMQPTAVMAQITYSSKSRNVVLRALESLIAPFTTRPSSTTMKFIVINDYWSINDSESLTEAMKQAEQEGLLPRQSTNKSETNSSTNP